MEHSNQVTGQIVLPDSAVPPGAARVIVQIEDVSRADAPSIVIAEESLENVELSPGRTVPFILTVPTDILDASKHYSVRAHIDISGSGTVDRGDFVSTQSHPVLTRGFGNEAVVPVKRV